MQNSRLATTVVAASIAAASASCANLGSYVWVRDYKAPAARDDGAYVIAPGDVLSVRVFNQDGMSGRGKVRPDGKISLPFLNDVEAAGYTPPVLAQQLQTRLKDFIRLPTVTVAVEEMRPLSVSVLGEVAKQGVLQLEGGAGVLQALAQAGGLTDYAHRDRIFVLRDGSPSVRVRFTFEDLARAEPKAASFRLRNGDVVMVE